MEGHTRGQQRDFSFLLPSRLVQLEQSEAKCEDALKTQKALTADLESMHSELENMTRSKTLVPVHSWGCGDSASTGSELAWACCVLSMIRGTRALSVL